MRLLFSAALIIAITACASSRSTNNAADTAASSEVQKLADQPSAPWAVKMQALSDTLSKLMPLVVSQTRFNDPKNADVIRTSTQRLGTLAHNIKDTKPSEIPNADPTMKVLSGMFAEDLDQALASLATGNREYARQLLRDTTSYCVQCHTQTTNGPNFPHLNLSINADELEPREQADFYAATRQFDKSLQAYEKTLNDREFMKKNPLEWEQAARSAVAIEVRVKNDAKETQNFLKAFDKNKKHLPKGTQDALNSWKRSANEWAKEKARPATGTNEEKLKAAEALMARAQARQEFPLDHTQDISFFRASSLTHQVLGSPDRDPQLSARALYIAGVSAEATRDMNFWTLHESYYEQCIRALPRSELARKCYRRLEESITLGYSGSGGTKIPVEIKRRLDRFKALSSEAKEENPQKIPGAN